MDRNLKNFANVGFDSNWGTCTKDCENLNPSMQKIVIFWNNKIFVVEKDPPKGDKQQQIVNQDIIPYSHCLKFCKFVSWESNFLKGNF